jgi:hypothetical protein
MPIHWPDLTIPPINLWSVPKQTKEFTMTQDQLKLFYKILETKNSWGKNEIKTLLLEICAGIRTEV